MSKIFLFLKIFFKVYLSLHNMCLFIFTKSFILLPNLRPKSHERPPDKENKSNMITVHHQHANFPVSWPKSLSQLWVLPYSVRFQSYPCRNLNIQPPLSTDRISLYSFEIGCKPKQGLGMVRHGENTFEATYTIITTTTNHVQPLYSQSENSPFYSGPWADKR